MHNNRGIRETRDHAIVKIVLPYYVTKIAIALKLLTKFSKKTIVNEII